MLTIESDALLVKINEKGAELTQITNKQNQIDYLWSGESWQRHAPILFPAIGRSNDNHYLISGQSYEMPQHGFARDRVWQVVTQTPASVTLRLTSNQQTQPLFPFNFELLVTYQIVENRLDSQYEVRNLDSADFSFALGSHPGFNVPLARGTEFTDYYLDFGEQVAQLDLYAIDPVPFRSGKRQVLALEKGRFELQHARFDQGLLLFDRPSQQVSLKSAVTDAQITLTTTDFPYMALWTLENQTENFLCIEPFAGLPDQYGQVQELLTKEANQVLSGGQSQQFKYQLTFE